MATENSWGDLFGAAGPFGLYYGAKGLGAAARAAPGIVGSPLAMGGAPGLAAATAAGVMAPTPMGPEPDIYNKNGQLNPGTKFQGQTPTLLQQPFQAGDTSNLSADEAQRGQPLNAPSQPPQNGGAVGAPPAAPSPSPQPGGALPSSMVFGAPDAGASAGGFRPVGGGAPQSPTAAAPPVSTASQIDPSAVARFQSPQGNPYYNGPGSQSFGAADPSNGGGGFGQDSGNTSKHQGLLSKFLAGLNGTNHNGLFGLFNPSQGFASGAGSVGGPNVPWQNPDRMQTASANPSMFSFPQMPTDI